MPNLLAQLILPRCPHCRVANPSLHQQTRAETQNYDATVKRFWVVYACARCGGCVLAAAFVGKAEISEMYPSDPWVDEAIPEPARTYLIQAQESLHAPAGAVMLDASAVDAMLKANEYKDGSLYQRIEKAAADHWITKDMAKWAHQVRLDANEPRHADENAPLPTEAEAKRSVEFASALAEILFVLPSKVTRGIADTIPSPAPA